MKIFPDGCMAMSPLIKAQRTLALQAMPLFTDLKIVFFGTPDFAVASLKALVDNGANIAAVITAPDKPSGRGMQLNAPAVKQYALTKDLRILQPEKLKNPEFIAELKE